MRLNLGIFPSFICHKRVERMEHPPAMNQFRKHNAFHPKPILMRRLSQSSVVESRNAVNIVSAICAVAFILYLPARIWQLRVSRAKNALRWQGRSKAVSTYFLSIS